MPVVFGSRLHIGLGSHAGVDVLENVAADRLMTITESSGKLRMTDGG
jgi:TRAP-type C4-dicarboxylate transport system permease small subunit